MAQIQLHAFCRKHETALWLALIVVVAAALRLVGLSFQSYWYDELFSAYYSNPGHSLDEVIRLTLADVHPPVYQVVMWLFYKGLGYNELAGRLPSALVGIATIPAIFLLGREMFDKRAGLYAAAFATVNYYLIYFSQEARSYAFLYFLCTLSFLYFVRALRGASWFNVVLYVVATLMLLYTHYFGLVLLVVQVLTLVLYLRANLPLDRKLLLRAGIAAAVISIGLVPLLPVMFMHANVTGFWIQQPAISFAYDYFLSYFAVAWLAGVFAALIGVGLVVGGIRPAINHESSWVRLCLVALVLWIVIGYLLPWVRGFFSQPVITDRNTIMVLPPLMILAGYGLTRLPGIIVQRALGSVVVLLSLWFLVIEVDYYGKVTKNQFRSMATTLINHGHDLPVYTLKFNHTKYNVYFEQLGSSLRSVDASVLEDKLRNGVAEPLFWIADAHMRRLQTDVEEKYGLVQVALYKAHGAVAELLVNPALATTIDIESAMLSGADGNWLSTGSVVWPSDNTKLLLALDKSSSALSTRNVQIDLLDSSSHVRETYAATLGVIPSTMLVKPDVRAGEEVRLVIRLPESESEPSVWFIRDESGESQAGSL